jgi:hypothetical protein
MRKSHGRSDTGLHPLPTIPLGLQRLEGEMSLRLEGGRRLRNMIRIERFLRVDYGNLEIGVTVDDPKAYTKSTQRFAK